MKDHTLQYTRGEAVSSAETHIEKQFLNSCYQAVKRRTWEREPPQRNSSGLEYSILFLVLPNLDRLAFKRQAW